MGAVPTPAPQARSKETDKVQEGKYVGSLHSGDRKRFMEQATFGPTPALDARLRRIRLTSWVVEQFE